ncbi:MAG: hypothetical protein COT38_03625 [Candidatus Omnitrophica bacterium CG08_land_8_20_14_0_20_41_16]|uniref:histidine kinase n=1 Tax=Candidatus Sherwoodlollariibacterium unditelluris TaxID=1974757 RepID=A0A2G9YKY1_9BACT|nr:MAG: hypothetical protein COX41_00930 [Candidatus Omnitrophica bacterium CG23_combo_of_CG06-09_8_20_14_all_41_10]PIS33763.1 MAG: hypothetical protein COT38_03625 [Candidatus Omnitrophica bacterium CG08_land_8_20_14_0_20_41_16]
MKSSPQDIQKSVYRIIDNSNAIVLYLDTKGLISICNKKLEEITGKDKGQMTGNHWLDILYRDSNRMINQQMFKAVMDASINYKRPNVFEGSIKDSNHNEHFISWNITPIIDDSHELEGILLLGNDVTLLKERGASLKNIDETLKNIFSSIKEYALYAINLDGNITYYGMGSESLFGWQKNEIIFKQVSLLHSYDDAAYKFPFILEQVRSLGHYELETYLIKKNGLSFPVILSVSQFLDAKGKIIGYIFIAKDITERKKLEYQIFQAEKLAAIDQLAAGMAHEINNPLFVISGRLEMILGQKRLSEKLKEDLNIINTQTDRIRKLVDRFLKFNRKTTPKLETLNINEVIDTVLPLLAYHKLPVVKIDIEKYFTPDLGLIKGDLNQLQEVFLNLLINAYQAMSIDGKITIKTSNFMDKFAEIRISDTGCGIAKENLKNIFTPFFSTKEDGTGLGLSICYNIIKSHNGSIDIESEAGKGTTFIIRLPFIYSPSQKSFRAVDYTDFLVEL